MKHVKLFEDFSINEANTLKEIANRPKEIEELFNKHSKALDDGNYDESDKLEQKIEKKAVELNYLPALLPSPIGIHIFFHDFTEKDWDELTGIDGFGKQIKIYDTSFGLFNKWFTLSKRIYNELLKNNIDAKTYHKMIEDFMVKWDNK